MDNKPTLIIPDPDSIKNDKKYYKLTYPTSFFYANDAFNIKYYRVLEYKIGVPYFLTMLNDKSKGTIQIIAPAYMRFIRDDGKRELLEYYNRGITWELYSLPLVSGGRV